MIAIACLMLVSILTALLDVKNVLKTILGGERQRLMTEVTSL